MRTYATILCLLLTFGPSWAAEPTLARLSFWMSPERMDEFATAYQQKLLPILKGHGLVESAQPSRATVDSVFSRLFEFNSPSDVVAKRRILRDDTKWAEQLGKLKVAWERGRFNFGHYATLAGPARSSRLAPGRSCPPVEDTDGGGPTMRWTVWQLPRRGRSCRTAGAIFGSAPGEAA